MNVGQGIAYKFQRNIEKGLPKGAEITNQWYDEKAHYNYNREQYCKGAGHFTQMIWKGSKYVGVGIAWDPLGKVVIVVNYKPCGNVPSMFKYNVSDISPLRDDTDSNSSMATDSDGKS